MSVQLRPYQIDCIEGLRTSYRIGHRRVVLCAPTGSGKTLMFTFMVANALKHGKKVMVVTDRIELMNQAGGAFKKFDIHPVTIEANKHPDLSAPCIVAMIETLHRRIAKPEYEKFIQSLDLIIFDECHKQAFNKIFSLISAKTFVIGCTATPHRESGQASLSDFYTDIVQSVDIPYLIEQGYLSKPRSFGLPFDKSKLKKIAGEYDTDEMAKLFEERKVYQGVIENYKRICPGKKAILFASNIRGSLEICTHLQKEGLPARHLDSEMSAAERADILQWFDATPNAILCNIGILTTGFDAPEIECVILYRATASLPLFLQMVGRGSRVTSEKKEFFILDFGGNITEHSHWEEPRVWSLHRKEKRKTNQAAPAKTCPSCNAIVPISTRKCEYCEHQFKSKQDVEDEEMIAHLEELSPGRRIAEVVNMPVEKMAVACKAGTVNPYAVLHKLRSRAEAERFIALIGWKKGWLFYNAHRYPNLQR